MNTGWDPLGVHPDGHGGANVALWAQSAIAVELCVFPEDGPEYRIPLTNKVFNIFHTHVSDLPVGTRYGFRVDGPWDPSSGRRWNPNKLLLDPYARAIDGKFELNHGVFGHVGADDLAINTIDSAPFVPRSVVADTWFDWGGDTHPNTAWGDTLIYEAHVRGLTMRNHYVPEHQRGTYSGLAHPAIIDYLRNIGATAIELMPIQHFVDETHLLKLGLTNYWGYNSIGFFAPHSRYASTGTRGEQVREFKEMVKALHAAGLEVILDVVYNHTAEGNELGPTLAFRGIGNDDYYRLTDDGRRYTDYTGTGNTFDVSHPHVLQLVMDSLRYWVTEMHVDGFRFDLASALARSLHDVDMLGNFMTTIQQDPVLRRVKLIAEPWDVGPGGYQVGEFPPLWTEWNGKYRDCVRDYWRGAAGIGELGWRLTGSADLYASEGRRPSASINFITAHDGFTMRDLVTFEQKHNEANLEGNRDGTDDNRSYNFGIEGETNDETINTLRRRQMRNLMTTLLLSTGVPMLTAGDEFGRTQIGNNNAYCQDNEISWLNWDWEPWQQELHAFTTSLVQLRRDHSAFRQRYFFAGRPIHEGGPKDLAWISPEGREITVDEWNSSDSRTLGMFIAGVNGGKSFLAVMHAGQEAQTFNLPGDPYGSSYLRVIDTEQDSSIPCTNELAGSSLAMVPHSMIVFEVND